MHCSRMPGKLMVRPHTIEGFDSIRKTITELRGRGYQQTFRREATCLICVETNDMVKPDGFEVDECYHFEDATNTDRERMLYAISCIPGFKGILVEPCFVYEDNISHEMLQKLNYYEKL